MSSAMWPCRWASSNRPLTNRLRPYQREVAAAITNSVFEGLGLTFSVEIARQGGKNELSAQIEMLLLSIYMSQPKNIVKCAPTFKPQTVISMRRLKDCLNGAGFNGLWSSEMGHIIRLDSARAIFLSAANAANVVGNTAHLLLEIDEAQDVSREKYSKEFKPMGAATNATTVHYGTAWDDATLLEEIKQFNLELEKGDGVRRHFRYDWQEVAKYNPQYLAYVEAERLRLGEDHPLFRTQYLLEPLSGGGFLSREQLVQLQGSHQRRQHPEAGKICVAGVDLAGEAEEETAVSLFSPRPKRDATVVTIGELDYSVCNELIRQPKVKIVEHYRWTGKKHAQLYARLVDLLGSLWHCRRIVVDSSGVGQPVSSFLRQAMGSKVIPFTFTAASKSKLGFNLLAAINSGRLKMYTGDGSVEYRDFWSEVSAARCQYRPSQTMNFFVDPAKGHDDFLMSLALLVQAAEEYSPRGARGRLV